MVSEKNNKHCRNIRECFNIYKMTIQELKKELSLTNKEIAEFFGLSAISYANSSAKKRYETGICRFYEHVKKLSK